MVSFPPFALNVTVLGTVKVNEAVPVSVPLVTITAHVPAAVAVSAIPVLLLPVTTHPVLVVE
jgi:hypothetical protein